MIVPLQQSWFSLWAAALGLPKKSLYTVAEVSDVTGVPRSTLYAEIKAGRLKAHVPRFRTRGVLVLPDAVDEWLERGR